MASFTCISCRVAFADADLQRTHYKTDWHRYNLKRKVSELPPVTAEIFQQKVLAQRAKTAEEQAEEEQKGQIYCTACRKHFSNQSTLDNHLKSRKHIEEAERASKAAAAKPTDEEIQHKRVIEENAKNRLLSGGSSSSKATTSRTAPEAMQGGEVEEVEEEEVDEWVDEPLGVEQCLFCTHSSESLEANVAHMTSSHSFFIPDIEYLVDLDGLISYLGAKVGEGHLCLWCSETGKSFHSVRAVQQHMVDRGHCKMLHEGETLVEYADFYDYRKSYPDHETTGDMEVDGEEEEGAPSGALSADDFQLTLPSGATVGHRQLARYYRQNLHVLHRASATAMSRILSQYRSLGWTGSEGIATQQKAKDIAFLQRTRQKYNMKLGVKSNKLQRHFRDQVFN